MTRVERIGPHTLVLGDCLEWAGALSVDAILGDPPYGIGYEVNARSWSGAGLDAAGAMTTERRGAIVGDDRPFDPAPWLGFPKVALFGANHFSQTLPSGGRWIVWDKRRDSAPDDHSDCELIWTNRPGADRIHRQKWRGVVREGEENCANSRKLHPNQKPVALLGFILRQIDVKAGEIVCDPYMGSASSAIAAIRLGMDFIGIEIDPEHFATALRRVREEYERGDLFRPAPLPQREMIQGEIL